MSDDDPLACYRVAMSKRLWRARDGFVGTIIGKYTTREGVHGYVLQQAGTNVVHVYRANSIEGTDEAIP